jgi:hypothetical protein
MTWRASLSGAIAVLAALTIGCSGYHGAAVFVEAAPPGPEAAYTRVDEADVETAKAVTETIATRFGMGPVNLEGLEGDEDHPTILIAMYGTPRSPRGERLRMDLRSHRDRSALSIGIADWTRPGRSEKTTQIAGELADACRAAFPGLRVRVEDRDLGLWSP